MEENIKVRWLTDHEQTKIAPKTLITQVLNENGSRFKDSFDATIAEMNESVEAGNRQIRDHANNTEIHVTQEEKDAWKNIEVPSLDGYATEEYVGDLFQKLASSLTLGFYCVEDVTVSINGIPTTYAAGSNVEIRMAKDDVWEIIPTSEKSILSLHAFPGALGTFYPWLEGVAQFSNILFDMNAEEFYSKWSQGNQGRYHVQTAQYVNCIFWSDNPYISDVARRTNYTLTHTAQLPLCYSTIPENTFKSFYLAFGVNSDPNWANQAYRDSFAAATWATQAFSYYGARVVGFPGHDSPTLTITLPKDCRGLMFDARNIECAGTFDAVNCTNFGAKSGSWREAFGDCPSLRRLYIKNLKVNLNISWSPIDYASINYIINSAANTNAITISVSPYTYNLLGQADFDLAASKNITIALISTNYVEDKRLGEIAGKADKTYVDTKIADLVNSAPETLDTLGELATALEENQEVVDILNASITNKQNKNVIVYRDSSTGKASMTAPEIMEKVRAGENVYYTVNLSGGTLHPYLEGADTGVFFYSNYSDNDRVIGTGILISADGTITTETYELEHLKDTTIHITSAERNRWNDTFTKTEIEGLLESKADKEELFSGSWNDLTDKPFKEIMKGYSTIYSTSRFPGTATLSVASSLAPGRYQVILNGVTYEFDLGSNTTQIGSAQGFPFTLRRNQSGPTTYTWLFQGGNTSTTDNSVTIRRVLTSVVTLEEKYIPTTIARTSALIGKAIANGGEIFNDYNNNTATGAYSHAEGYDTEASGSFAHSEGCQSNATEAYAHAEGVETEASGTASHSEGAKTKATNIAAHAEGYESEATAQAAHAEGYGAKATGDFSHAEGELTIASGYDSHAEGQWSVASGQGAHAEGLYTIAAGHGQHAEGFFNIEDTENKYIHIAGNGTSGENRSNAYTLDENGNAWYSGDVYVGSTSGTNQDEGSKKLATEEYVDTKQEKITDTLILADTITGAKYKLQIQNGQLVTSLIEEEV